jgi:DNA-binding NarL/FixJ family response regulator
MNEKNPIPGSISVFPEQYRTRILIADRERLFRHCLMILLRLDPALQIVGEAKDGEEAVIMATATRPDMVIMGTDLPGLSGPKAARLIRERLPESKIRILSIQQDEKLISESFSSGASAYALKDADHEEFLNIACAAREVGFGVYFIHGDA